MIHDHELLVKSVQVSPKVLQSLPKGTVSNAIGSATLTGKVTMTLRVYHFQGAPKRNNISLIVSIIFYEYNEERHK